MSTTVVDASTYETTSGVIVVTGAGGQLGTHVLAGAGSRAVVGYRSVEFDITDPAAAAATVPDGATVINCAAYTAVDAAETDRDAAIAGNVEGPRVLAEACARVGARLVHLSTDYVFAGDAAVPYEPDDAPDPRTVYGRTKLDGERAILNELPTATIVRTAWVYSATGSDFVATMIRLEAERDTLTVVNDQLGSPTYAADLAAGLLELADRDDPPAGVLHATNAGEATWFDLARATFEGIGADPQRVKPCSSAEFVRPAPRPAYSVLSSRSWVSAGLTPLRPWRDGLDAALAARASARA